MAGAIQRSARNYLSGQLGVLRDQNIELMMRIVDLRRKILSLQRSIAWKNGLPGSYYRFICPLCLEPSQVPVEGGFTHTAGVIAGKCSSCYQTVRFLGSVRQNELRERIFKVLQG
jgi:hypothetical protein